MPDGITETGKRLLRVYRRLVPLHASFAASDDASRRRLAREVMDVLADIKEDPEFRAAELAEAARRAEAPTPEELAIDERNRQVAARFKETRAKRRGRAFA